MIFVRPIGSISCVRVAAATLALSPMPPKRRRLSSKASAQAHRNKVCNRNRRKRRDALGKLNQLTTDLDLPIPKLNVRLPGLPPGMTKVLRTLNKRCVGKEVLRTMTSLRRFSWIWEVAFTRAVSSPASSRWHCESMA